MFWALTRIHPVVQLSCLVHTHQDLLQLLVCVWDTYMCVGKAMQNRCSRERRRCVDE